MTNIALYAPTLLQLRSSSSSGQLLAGAELSLLHLRQALENLGHKVVCFTNVLDSCSDQSLCSVTEFHEEDFEVVIYSRTYGRKHRTGTTSTRRLLWVHDTVEESASLVVGGINALGKLLSQYHHLVFVSAWHRMQYATYFPKATLWLTKSSSIRHLLPEISIFRGNNRRFDVIHTAHPRKALSAVLDIFDLLAAQHPSLRLALVDSAGVYQDGEFVYKGRQTSLSNILKRRYGISGPPFEVLSALPQLELIPLLAQCEILLHPDQSTETGATTVLEAIQAGCATVVSDLGCLPEIASATGSVLAPPSMVGSQVYADAVCAALEQRKLPTRCDIGDNIRNHNFLQSSRWANAITASNEPTFEPCIVAGVAWQDLNGILADHPKMQTMTVSVPVLQDCKLSIHLFPQRGMALMGVLEPTALPSLSVDLDILASECSEKIKTLLNRLAKRGISRLIMRIAAKPDPCTLHTAWLCAAVVHGARVTTIRQLSILLNRWQTDELRERAIISPRVREQIRVARTKWIIRHLFVNSPDFTVWFDAYDRHRNAFGSMGISRERARELLDCQGPLGVHGAIAIDPTSDEVCGFYLVLRQGEFAALHSWGTDQRYQSNLHKLLIADAARLARQRGVNHFEYGSDLGEYGKSDGLNTLYRRFGGRVSPSLQLVLPVPTALAFYDAT